MWIELEELNLAAKLFCPRKDHLILNSQCIIRSHKGAKENSVRPVYDQAPVFRKSTLESGVRVVTEHHIHSRATSVGIFVDIGSRDDPQDLCGAAHFIEHLVFKGTKTRSAFEIAKVLEAVGGEINAYTAREYTCFHGVTLREDLALSVEVLSDLVSQALFEEEPFELEKNVVLQEIDESADQLEEIIFDDFVNEGYHGMVGRPILGTASSISQIKLHEIKQYYRSQYHGKNLVVSVAGSVDHDQVVDLVNQFLNHDSIGDKLITKTRAKSELVKFEKKITKASEQIHMLYGWPSCSFKASHRFDSYIVNSLFGGGMTSRLYQKIREDRGLAYSVYSHLMSLSDSGVIFLYAGTSKDNYIEVRDLISAEVDLLCKNGIQQEELDFFKNQVVGSILLNSDDIENRMNSLGINELIFGEYRPVEKVLAEIQMCSKESTHEYIGDSLNCAPSFFTMGPIK